MILVLAITALIFIALCALFREWNTRIGHWDKKARVRRTLYYSTGFFHRYTFYPNGNEWLYSVSVLGLGKLAFIGFDGEIYFKF